MAYLAITNELAQTAGLIANRFPDRAIEIRWMNGLDETEWLIAATDGTNDAVYLARDDMASCYTEASNELLLQLEYPHPAITAQRAKRPIET